MKKSRFIEDTLNINKKLLKLKRKEVLGYSIFFILFALVPNALLKQVTDINGITLTHILAGVLFILVILALVLGIKALYKLTKMIYTKPIGYFIVYLFLIFMGGFVLGLFTIFGLISLWFEVRSVLKETKKG